MREGFWPSREIVLSKIRRNLFHASALIHMERAAAITVAAHNAIRSGFLQRFVMLYRQPVPDHSTC